MNRNKVIIGLLLAIIIVSGTFFLKRTKSCDTKSCDKQPNNVNVEEPNMTSVNIKNFAFDPSRLEIKKGDEVTFTNNDSAPHTVTANDNSFDSGSIAPGKEYKKKFDNVGSYPYHCSIHPNMKGEIIVKD